MEPNKRTERVPLCRCGVKLRGGHLLFAPTLLGAGVLFAVFLDAVRFFSNDMLPASVLPLFPFVNAIGFSAMLFEVLFGALCSYALRQSTVFSTLLSFGRAHAAIGAAATAAGLLFVAPAAVPELARFIDPAVLGCLFGVGLVVLASVWGKVFSRFEPEDVVFNAALSIALAGVLHFIGEPIALTGASSVFQFALLAISCALLFSELGPIADEGDAPIESHDEPASDDASSHGQIASAFRLLWMPLVGACISCFIFGLTWDSVIADEPMRAESTLHILKLVIGPLIAAVPVAIMVAVRPDSSVLRTLNQAIYPLTVAFLLALPTVMSDNAFVAGIVEVLKPATFAVIALTVWSNMASAVRSTSLSAQVIFPFCFGIFAASFTAGLHLIYVIGTEGRTICLVILTIYLALIAVSFALGNRAERSSRVEPTAEAAPKNYIHQRCDVLATERALSPREREVLYYLGRGYNHGYIATQLYISENTVRTHVRHIYGKLEISSREELLALIDAVLPH